MRPLHRENVAVVDGLFEVVLQAAFLALERVTTLSITKRQNITHIPMPRPATTVDSALACLEFIDVGSFRTAAGFAAVSANISS